MPSVLRNAVTAAVLAAGLGLPAAPAQAVGYVHFTGTAHVNCHGCGCSTGTATLNVTGVTGAGIVIAGAANASFVACTPVGPGCLAQGQAAGTVSGAVNVSFTWSRVGMEAVITTTGDINGAGRATIIVTSPVGNPCGGPATFTVEGSVGGT